MRGYRTDLSVAGDAPVDDFITDIETVRAQHASILPRLRKASIGPGGASGISGMTPFNYPAIQTAYTGWHVTADSEMRAGETYPVFNVFSAEDARDPSYTVWPNWDRGHVGFVISGSKSVAGPGGAQIGRTLFGELEKSDTGNCFIAQDDGTDVLICACTKFYSNKRCVCSQGRRRNHLYFCE